MAGYDRNYCGSIECFEEGDKQGWSFLITGSPILSRALVSVAILNTKELAIFGGFNGYGKPRDGAIYDIQE